MELTRPCTTTRACSYGAMYTTPWPVSTEASNGENEEQSESVSLNNNHVGCCCCRTTCHVGTERVTGAHAASIYYKFEVLPSTTSGL